MRAKTIWTAVGGAVAMVALWLVTAAAPDPAQGHFPAITIGGLTNVYTDLGSALLRNGVPVGGGGSTVWTNSSGVNQLLNSDPLIFGSYTNVVNSASVAGLDSQGLLFENVFGVTYTNQGLSQFSRYLTIDSDGLQDFFLYYDIEFSQGPDYTPGQEVTPIFYTATFETTGTSIYRNEALATLEAIGNGNGNGKSAGLRGKSSGVESYGVVGIGLGASTNISIGVSGYGNNSGGGNVIGGFFAIGGNNDFSPNTNSAALVAENRTTGKPIFIGRSNLVEVCSFNADGSLSAGNTNQWILKSVTEGATTNLVITYNGKDYTLSGLH